MKESYLALIRRKQYNSYYYNSYYYFNGNIASINKYMINLIVCMIQGEMSLASFM